MKTKLALLALSFILTFGMIADVASAAITASTGISLTAITLTDAYYGTAPASLNVSTNPGQVYLSFRIANGGEYFTLNSVSIDITLNGIPVSSENYNSYLMVATTWSRVGVYNTGTYAIDPMNQGAILVGCGSLDGSAPYSTTMVAGDVYQAKMTYDVQDQGVFTSVGTMTYVPEPATTGLIVLSTFCFLRRKRK